MWNNPYRSSAHFCRSRYPRGGPRSILGGIWRRFKFCLVGLFCRAFSLALAPPILSASVMSVQPATAGQRRIQSSPRVGTHPVPGACSMESRSGQSPCNQVAQIWGSVRCPTQAPNAAAESCIGRRPVSGKGRRQMADGKRYPRFDNRGIEGECQ